MEEIKQFEEGGQPLTMEEKEMLKKEFEEMEKHSVSPDEVVDLKQKLFAGKNEQNAGYQKFAKAQFFGIYLTS